MLAVLRNRRKSERQPTNQVPCIIKINSVPAEGVLLDASAEGAKIGGILVSLLFADQVVEVQTPDDHFFGRCRTVHRDSDGLFQIGLLKTSDQSVEPSPTVLINSFVQNSENKSVCVPLAVEDDWIRVQLLDGQQMNVPAWQIVQMTREERLEELCNEPVLKQSLLTYDRPSTSNDFVDRTTILNHEFGPPNLCMVNH